jgi:CheY-like chemotaxis protein
VLLEVARELPADPRPASGYPAAPGPLLHFTVSDTGSGIAEEQRTTIFESFQQADTSLTRRHGGAGLGLAIAARLVGLMQGRIWLESQVGRGSRFHFTVCLDPVQAAGEAIPLVPAQLRGVRVLVVDDSPMNRHILTEILRDWRMAPTAVAGGGEALEILRRACQAQDPYPLILADAQMPDVDGFLLAERIAQDPHLGGAVVMMLAAGGRPGDVARCEKLGIAAHLSKPIQSAELLAAIESASGIGDPGQDAKLPLERQTARGGLRILVADHSLVNQKLAAALLERAGHAVTVVGNGGAALAAIEAEKFDLVLMNFQMAEMDGLEAATEIRMRQRQTGAHTPIIAMTADTLDEDRQRCLKAGMDGYISTPVRAEELFAAIATWRSRSSVGHLTPVAH